VGVSTQLLIETRISGCFDSASNRNENQWVGLKTLLSLGVDLLEILNA